MYKIAVLGGGISGLTTAYLLKFFGYEVSLISEHFLTDNVIQADPAFSSQSPAASIIPHSLFGKHVLPSFIDSQEVFRKLLEDPKSGVKMHLHYELFEVDREPYDYCEFMDHFEPISGYDEYMPFLNKGIPIFGWRYNCLFTDWNIYPGFLLNKYKNIGGIIVRNRISKEDLGSLAYDAIINCTGLGAIPLFDEQEKEIFLGHTIILDDFDDSLLFGKAVSYNYEPTPNVYSSVNGAVQDVYSYSRNNQLLLGGSRLAGSLQNGSFVGDKPATPLLSENGIDLAEQIYTLNKELISNGWGIDLDDFPKRTFKTGYRYIRNTKDGFRIEKETSDSKLIIHNYGNGGGGVTVSWGAALLVLNLFNKEIGNSKIDLMQLLDQLSF